MFRAIFRRLFFLGIIASIFFTCFFLYKRFESTNDKNLVVAFGNYALYESDLDGIHQEERADYIKDWLVTHYLEDEFNNEADKNAKIEIAQKVAAYKSKLCAHMQLAAIITKRRDLGVSDQEIEQFYNKNQKSFLLQDHVFKGIYMIIPKSLKENLAIKQLLTQNVKDIESLKKFCFIAKEYVLDDTVWLIWDTKLENTPYAKQDVKNNFFEKNLYVYYDKTYAYYLWITELKKAGEVAPLSIVKDTVKQQLTFNKKLELEKQIINESLILLKQKKIFKSHEK